jgi:spermidine/putrescine transport system substrate-binding protein
MDETDSLVAPSENLLEPTDWEANNSESLSHLTWTGYDSDNVQQPFRDKFNAETNINLFQDNAKVFNQMKSGDWETYHHSSLDLAWATNLAEAGLLREADYEAWRQYTHDKFVDTWDPEEGNPVTFIDAEEGQFVESRSDGKLYSWPQRWGFVGVPINTDTVDIEDAKSYDIAFMGDKYDIGIADNQPAWQVQPLMLMQGIDPYREHTEEEIDKTAEAAKRLFSNAKTALPGFSQIAQALKSGSIDVLCFNGNFVTTPVRIDGNLNVKTIVPTERPNGLKQGIVWAENTGFVKGEHPRISDNYLAYMMSEEASYQLSFPDSGPPNPVPTAAAWDRWTDEQKEIIRVDELDQVLENSVFFQGVPDIDKFLPRWREARQYLGKDYKASRRSTRPLEYSSS